MNAVKQEKLCWWAEYSKEDTLRERARKNKPTSKHTLRKVSSSQCQSTSQAKLSNTNGNINTYSLKSTTLVQHIKNNYVFLVSEKSSALKKKRDDSKLRNASLHPDARYVLLLASMLDWLCIR